MGIGDDAAILKCNGLDKLVVSTDTLVEGTHFKVDDDANDIGHKCLAVSFSDLASMGVKPQWVTLNLTMPEFQSYWFEGFINGFADLLSKHDVALIGGDTTQGPCAVTITVFGEAPLEDIKRRGHAQVGDLIAVTGYLGSAAFALANPYLDALCDKALHRPTPRLDMIEPLKNIANAVIDVSDGLLADLGHICLSSNVGAKINVEQIPVRPVIKSQSDWLQHALTGGDDYQLCFTFPEHKKNKLPKDCSIIGVVTANPQLQVCHHNEPITFQRFGYAHFN